MRNDLFVASENGYLEKITNLYQQDGRVLSELTFQGDNVLHIAAREGHTNIVDWIHGVQNLESSLAQVRNNDENTPLHEAARNPDPDLIEILLQHNKTCASQRNKFGETPLTIACKYGHRETVDRLLRAYSPIETLQPCSRASNKEGVTSLLHAAVHGGCVETVRAILNHRTWHNDLMTEKDEYGRCAVHVAAMKGRWDIIRLFVDKIRDCVEIRSSDHKSVLHFAVECNRFKVVHNLLRGKNELKVAELVSHDPDLSHNTALHLAAKNGVDSQLLDLLLSSQSLDINALNNEGLTALDIASAESQHNSHCATIVRKLKGARAKHSKRVPNTIPHDTVNAHMVVASLIATVTFAAIFQIPGGTEDDKNNIHYGAAKLALHKLFRLFIFTDSAAFITSLAVVVAWLGKKRWQQTHFGSLFPYLLSDISEVNLVLSMFWTAVAFVIATIMVIIPHDYETLNSKDKEAFSKYKSFWQFEILLVIVTPYLSAYMFIAPHMAVAVIRRALRNPEIGRTALRRLPDPSTLRILLAHFFIIGSFILAITFQ